MTGSSANQGKSSGKHSSKKKDPEKSTSKKRKSKDAGSKRKSSKDASAATDAGSYDARKATEPKQKQHKQNVISRYASQWWHRLLGGVAEGSFSDQEELYSSHETTRDYIWNTVGMITQGIMFPILTVVVTQLSGTEQAGMFSLAFVTASLLMVLANYGVRTYQVSDLDEVHTFADYQINRVITCILMLLVGWIYCKIRGYTGDMLYISIGVYLYRMVDALADVYEGRLQQVDKMYLSGISQAFRSVVVFLIFTVVLLISGSVGAASIAMGIAAIATFFFLTFPLTLLETPSSHSWSAASIISLFKQATPLFVALFLYTFIDSMPKFVMEGVLPYDAQLYFNALYFPAQIIFIVAQLVYKPLLVELANIWANPSMHKKFDQSIVAMCAVICGITFVMFVIMGTIGIPIMSFFYGLDFEEYRGLLYIMLVAGGVTAAIDFLYQVITVLRRQSDVTKLYLITFGFSLFVPTLLINFTGLPGAVIGYLIVMCILLVLLVSEYIAIRGQFNQTSEVSRSQTLLQAAGSAQSGASSDSTAPAAVANDLVMDFDPGHKAEEEAFDDASAQGTLDEEQLQRAGYVKIPMVEQAPSQSSDSDGMDLDEPAGFDGLAMSGSASKDGDASIDFGRGQGGSRSTGQRTTGSTVQLAGSSKAAGLQEQAQQESGTSTPAARQRGGITYHDTSYKSARQDAGESSASVQDEKQSAVSAPATRQRGGIIYHDTSDGSAYGGNAYQDSGKLDLGAEADGSSKGSSDAQASNATRQRGGITYHNTDSNPGKRNSKRRWRS